MNDDIKKREYSFLRLYFLLLVSVTPVSALEIEQCVSNNINDAASCYLESYPHCMDKKYKNHKNIPPNIIKNELTVTQTSNLDYEEQKTETLTDIID